MNYRRFLFLAAISFLSVVGVALIVSGYFLIRKQIAVHVLEKNAETLKTEYSPLRVLILSRSDQAVSARCFFYDADGREIASFERSWNGWELDVESILVPSAGRIFVFPSRISTGQSAPRGGTDLFGYYDTKGFPAIFASTSLNPSTYSAFSGLFAFIKAFGGTKRDLKRLRDFEVGAVYEFTAYSDGRIVFTRE
ncbi:MAG: hypothetical protein WCT14_03310 [Treponemataceae bacterium]